MNYEQFLLHCNRYGLNPSHYLIPLELFNEIDNQAHYTTQDIAYFLSKSERQIRRWFTSGHIVAFKKRPWTCKGIELKNSLFQEYQKEILKRMDRSLWCKEEYLRI
ncbi:hypothetical protein [Paenibacillus sp. FSL E2-0201]|uniref:hypothetical protein n=1 Tax=Paenibacillus sp. FSL E2-0201 TaxID=2954726 RepID=UPI0030DD915E